MARRASGKWAVIVAAAERSGLPHAAVAKRHGVTVAALKYHLYKARRAGGGPQSVRVLPVRTDEGGPALTVRLGVMTLQFRDDCDPSYIAAVLRALGEPPC